MTSMAFGRFSQVLGTGSYLPKRIVTNQELAERLETSHEWIVERTGIEQRHLAADDETTADLAEQAARHALEAANLKTVDLIIVATTTPDHLFPSVATQLQARLGLTGAAFDVQAVCSGFIYALTIADQFIRTGMSQRALVVGAETFSRLLDWNDRGTCVLFGDGAGAVVLAASSAPGIESCHLHADGRYKELLWVPGGPGQSADHSLFVAMRGAEVFRVAVNALGNLVDEVLTANALTADQIDWLVPHQANARILHAIAKKLSFPPEKVLNTIAQHANTSAASVPLALDQGIRDGRIQRGQRLLLEAFGGGFTWGACLLRY